MFHYDFHPRVQDETRSAQQGSQHLRQRVTSGLRGQARDVGEKAAQENIHKVVLKCHKLRAVALFVNMKLAAP